MKSILVVLGLVLCAGSAAAGSPWTRPAGGGYVQAAFYAIPTYDELFGGDDAFVTSREITDLTLELYAEHGLVDGWTVVGSLPFKMVSTGGVSGAPSTATALEKGSLDTWGNARLGVRRQLAHGDWVSAVQLDVELPSADFDRATGLRSGIAGTAWVPSFSVGQGRGRSYWFAHAGVAIRDDGYSDQFRGGIEYGRQVFRGRALFVAALEVVDSFRNGDRVEAPTNLATGLYVDEQEVVSPVLKGIWPLNDTWGLSATLQGGFDGNLVARSPFLGLALFAEYGGR